MLPPWHQHRLSERRSWFARSENEPDRPRSRAASSAPKDQKTAEPCSIIGAPQQATEKSRLPLRSGVAVGFHGRVDWFGFLRLRLLLYLTRGLHLNRLLLQLRAYHRVRQCRNSFDRLKVLGLALDAFLRDFLLFESRDRDLRLLQCRELLLDKLGILIRDRSVRSGREQIRLPFLQIRRPDKGQKSSRNRGIIVVAASLARFVEQ